MTSDDQLRLRLRRERVMWNSDDEESVVLDIESSTYFSLNASAALLWERLVDGATERELVSALVDRLGAPAERAEGDVAQFVAALQERGLLDAE